jgi:uncharacterized cupredoxin-like copper-binding protein
MPQPRNLLRTGALALATISLLVAGCGASAAPTLTFVAAPTSPPGAVTAAPSPVVSLAPTAAIVVPPTIDLAEWTVDTASTLKAGTIKFKISNSGTIAHELLVFKSDLQPAAYPTNPAGGIVEEGGGVDLVSEGENIDPGGTQTRSVTLTPGTYLFVCNIPGHFKAGMFTVVTVTP